VGGGVGGVGGGWGMAAAVNRGAYLVRSTVWFLFQPSDTAAVPRH